MASSAPQKAVVVVGAGIFGVASAVHLARRGARVTLVSDGRPAGGASGRSLSWLNSSGPRSPDYHRLRMAGIDRYRTLASRHPHVPWLRFDGGLTWGADDPSNQMAADHAHERRIGYDSRLLAAHEVDAVTPGIDAGAATPQGAIFNAGEGWVDLPSLIGTLLAEFAERGGRLVSEAGKASVVVAGRQVMGVAMADGTHLPANAVLVATGPAVPRMAAAVGRRIPDATPIALLVRTKPLAYTLRADLNTPRVAIRPTPAGALVLDSGWSEREVVTHPDGTFEVKDATVQGLLDEAAKVLAGNPRLVLDAYDAGPKPIPVDGEPVFGPLEGIAGYYVAFSHSGATLGLIAGELLADEIVTGEPHPLLASFRPARFG